MARGGHLIADSGCDSTGFDESTPWRSESCTFHAVSTKTRSPGQESGNTATRRVGRKRSVGCPVVYLPWKASGSRPIRQ